MKFRRICSLLLIFAMLTPLLPIQAAAADPEPVSIDNGYLQVTVNEKNGGFDIGTLEGNALIKSDNNKNLLYPSGENDTSFTTLRVERGGQTTDYIFGGKYPGSSAVTVTAEDTSITATWSVDTFTIKQRLELESDNSQQHGMVSLTYLIENSGAPADLQLRILLDTALGDQDYAYYEALSPAGTGDNLIRVQTERALTTGEYQGFFFAYDDLYVPTITAYNMNLGMTGYKDADTVTFGHWNNLAATAFDYPNPDTGMDFTNPYNEQYLTADSAYALYYDLGEVFGAVAKAGTIYGVYSNKDVDPEEERVTVNLSAPEALGLSADSKSYTDGAFNLTAIVNHFIAAGAQTLDRVALVMRTADGIYPALENGAADKSFTQQAPYTRYIDSFAVGATNNFTIPMVAEVRSETQYRKVRFEVYDVSGPEGDMLLTNKIIGTAECYIYCPGGEEDLPVVQITGGSPDLLYTEGNRYFYLTGSGFSTLKSEFDSGRRTLVLQRIDGTGEEVLLPPENLIIDAAANTANLLIATPLPIGQYQLTMRASGTSGLADISSPALQFTTTDNRDFKNDSYGLVAVVKSQSLEYTIETFATEAKFEEKYGNNMSSVLLIFRGEFTAEKSGDRVVAVQGYSASKKDNVMSVNNVLDIQEGSVIIKKDGDTVKVDFDAKLYTTGARTTVWSGTSCFTGLKDGTNYALLPYDSDGERLIGKNLGGYTMDEDTKPITLLWGMGPVGAGMQALAGMLLNLQFGNLGVMVDGSKEDRRVISFGAELDLGFLIPSPSGGDEEGAADESGVEDYLMKLLEMAKSIDLSEAPSDILRELFQESVNTMLYGVGGDDDEEITASIKVPDVLFGGGFIGFICEAEVKLPSYIEGFPELEGKIEIKTVGNWSLGVEGKLTFTSMTLEASLGIKSYKGIPVPDKFYLFVGGFTPGINVDGFGVLWIMGGGGGIDNIYDTIFCPGALPPLTLMLSVQASIMQVFEARADIALSLRGIDLKLSDGKIMKIKVINSMRLKLDWYPEFYFLASVNLNILDTIIGSGYIVVDEGFFEFAARAQIKVPDAVPFFGGINVAQADLGASSERIYGAVEVIGIGMGVVYYWGGDFEFGRSSDIGAAPTYPELLGLEDIPVGYDEETGRTLYMHVGTNLTVAAAQVLEGEELAELLDGSAHKVQSAQNRLTHKLTLGAEDAGGHILTFSYPAATAEEALTLRNQITFGGASMRFLRDEGVNDPNANYTYADGTATIALFLRSGDYEKAHDISTPTATNLMLLEAAALPTVTNLGVTGGTMTLTGTQLDAVESVSLILVNTADESDIYFVDQWTESFASDTTLTKTVTIPANVPTGNYRYRATATIEGYVSETVESNPFDHVNNLLPGAPALGAINSVGDGMMKVNVTPAAVDGYFLTVYDGNGEETHLSQIMVESGKDLLLSGANQVYPVFETDDEGALVLVDGTPNVIDTRQVGLTNGATYTVGVTAYKIVDDQLLCSTESKKDFVYQAATPATFTVVGTPTPKSINTVQLDPENPYAMPTYTVTDIALTITASESMSGSWTLNGGDATAITATDTIAISLTGLEEGEHCISITGKDASGDNVNYDYLFAVDTLPPRLQISAPTNGSFFAADGTLNVSFIGDDGAAITIAVDGAAIYEGILTASGANANLSADGLFEATYSLVASYASHTVTITVTDAAGNQTVHTSRVYNEGLGKMEDIRIYSGDQDITDQNFLPDTSDGLNDAPLSLRGTVTVPTTLRSGTSSYDLVIDDPTLVSFAVMTHEGTASVDQEHKLSLSENAKGMVTGRLLVSDIHTTSASATFGATKVEKEPPKDDGDKNTGGSGGNSNAETTLPDGLPIPDSVGRELDTIKSEADQWVTYPLPEGVDPDRVVVTITDSSGNGVLLPITSVKDGNLIFYAPVRGTYHIMESNVTFTDIDGHWGERDIIFTAVRGLFNGTGGGAFSPDVAMTRAMVVTLLGRLENAEPSGEASVFTDVETDSWYSDYVTWAHENGIVRGVSDTSFEPEREITRQELCTILYRYLTYRGWKPELKGLDYADKSDIADWAVDGVDACSALGLIRGYNSLMRPLDVTTRAEGATVFARLIALFFEQQEKQA